MSVPEQTDMCCGLRTKDGECRYLLCDKKKFPTQQVKDGEQIKTAASTFLGRVSAGTYDAATEARVAAKILNACNEVGTCTPAALTGLQGAIDRGKTRGYELVPAPGGYMVPVAGAGGAMVPVAPRPMVPTYNMGGQQVAYLPSQVVDQKTALVPATPPPEPAIKAEPSFENVKDNVIPITHLGEPTWDPEIAELSYTEDAAKDSQEEKDNNAKGSMLARWFTNNVLLKIRPKYPRLQIEFVKKTDKLGSTSVGMGFAVDYFSTRVSEAEKQAKRKDNFKQYVGVVNLGGSGSGIDLYAIDWNTLVVSEVTDRDLNKKITSFQRGGRAQAMKEAKDMMDQFIEQQYTFPVLGFVTGPRRQEYFRIPKTQEQADMFAAHREALDNYARDVFAMNGIEPALKTSDLGHYYLPQAQEGFWEILGTQRMYAQIKQAVPAYEIPIACLGIGSTTTQFAIMDPRGVKKPQNYTIGQSGGMQGSARDSLLAGIDLMAQSILENPLFDQLYNSMVKAGMTPCIALKASFLNSKKDIEIFKEDARRYMAERSQSLMAQVLEFDCVTKAKNSRKIKPRAIILFIDNCPACLKEKEYLQNMDSGNTQKVLIQVDTHDKPVSWDRFRVSKFPAWVCKNKSEYTMIKNAQEAAECVE